MELRLRGNRALVTGTSRTLGRAIAEGLAEEGCDLVITSRDPEKLRAVADSIKQKHESDRS